MDTSNLLQGDNDCWNHIGVEGDRSCVELKKVIHCRNCPVYSKAGRSLLEREAPFDYLNEWTAVLGKTQEEPSWALADQATFRIGRAVDTLSVIIFRLSDELFALPTRVLQEVTHLGVIHKLPHRSNDLLLGLVNIRGEILLCVSVGHLLGLKTATNPPSSPMNLQRMLVLGHKDSKLVFPVDEVHRIYRIHLNEVKAPPVVVAKANETYTQGVIDWHQEKVNYLNTELLLDALARKII
jgi:chemotaxis-related protein WspD